MDGVRAVRGLIIAVALAASIGSPVLACSRIVPVQQGETEQQAWQRDRGTFQDERFRESSSVFVADVVELKRTGSGRDQGLEVAIQPLLAVKGPMPESVLRYQVDFKGTACGDWDLPSVGYPGLFYADARSSVKGMIVVARLEDQALRDRLSEEIDNAPLPSEVKPSIVDQVLAQQISSSWPWIGTGLLVSLVVGFVIGRVSKPTKRQPKVK